MTDDPVQPTSTPPHAQETHALMDEERRLGGIRSGEARRQKRDQAQRLAAEKLSGMTSRSLERIEALLDDPHGHVSLRASREVLDRVAGRSNHDGLQLPADADRDEIRHHRGMNLGDVVRVAVEFDLLGDALDDETAFKLLDQLLERGLIRLADEPLDDARTADMMAVAHILLQAGAIRCPQCGAEAVAVEGSGFELDPDPPG